MKTSRRCFFRALAILYFPTLLVASLFPKTNDAGLQFGFNLLFFFLYSFPFWCVLVEITLTKRSRTRASKRIRALRLLVCAGILCTLIQLKEYLRFALILAAAWLVLRLLGALIPQDIAPEERS